MTEYNLKNPAVKRLMKEAQELREPTTEYFAHPLEDNLFEWHFTLRGPPGSDYEGGLYHGRITLPPEYPMKPPNIILLTPNGRFEVNKKICLSISGHHPETWQPSWSIRTTLVALIGFLPTHGNGAIGSLEYKPEERKILAQKSQNWKCSHCGFIKNILVENTKTPRKDGRVLGTSIENSEVSHPTDLQLDSGISNKNSKIEHEQLNGFENHASSPQSAMLNSQENGSLARNRHLTSNQATTNLTSETHTVSSETIQNLSIQQSNSGFNFSLFAISLIVFVLIALIARRLFYQ